MSRRRVLDPQQPIGPELVADLGAGAPFSVWLRGKRSQRPARKRVPPLPPSAADPRRRTIAGRYELVARMGVGAMGEVWAARDKRERRNVALKLLRPELCDSSAEARVRFAREAMVLSRLSSPYVVELYDWGQDGHTPYMAMELVEGVTLERVLADEGRLEPWEVCFLVSDLAQGLYEVHREGVVHRDLKPGNIMLFDQGGERSAKLLDFGVARPAVSAMAITGARMLGTMHYLSPEQLAGGPVDLQCDLWALAVIAYRAITGYMPFDGADVVELVECIKLVAPPPPSLFVPQLPHGVDAFFARALCKDPAYRFHTALELAETLYAALAPVRSGEHRRLSWLQDDEDRRRG